MPGTSLALRIGHRKSLDFDLFAVHEFDSQQLSETLEKDFAFQQTFIAVGSTIELICYGNCNTGIYAGYIDQIRNGTCSLQGKIIPSVHGHCLIRTKIDAYSIINLAIY